MNLTLSQMATRVLRNCQIPEDSTTPSVQALADVKLLINERAYDVYSRRNWPEFFILGSYAVPANTRQINLSSITPDTGFTTSGNGFNAAFYSAVTLRNGTDNIFAEDPGAIRLLQADLWTANDSPRRMINRGQSGVRLLGQYAVTTTVNFYGKAKWQALTDSETWIMENSQCLIAGATADLIKVNDRDDTRAAINYQEYEACIAKMISNVEEQMGNVKRIIPQSPFTKDLWRNRDFSVIGNRRLW